MTEDAVANLLEKVYNKVNRSYAVHKFKALFTKHPYSMYGLKISRDYRNGKVTKEGLDK